MAKTKTSGFPRVEISNVTLAKVVTAQGKTDVTLKIEPTPVETETLASFAHRGAHLKLTLTEFDPELPLPAGD